MSRRWPNKTVNIHIFSAFHKINFENVYDANRQETFNGHTAILMSGHAIKLNCETKRNETHHHANGAQTGFEYGPTAPYFLFSIPIRDYMQFAWI